MHGTEVLVLQLMFDGLVGEDGEVLEAMPFGPHDPIF